MNAEASVIELENLAPGSAWSELLASSKSLIAAESASADPAVFPLGAPPVTSDLLGQYTYCTGRFGAANYDLQCAELHDRALIDNPGLAAMLRSQECLADNGDAAARFATPTSPLDTHEAAHRRAAAVAVARYKLAIARQLAAIDGPLGDAARTLVKCDELERRLAAAVAKLEAQATLEVARIQAEHAAAPSAAERERKATEAATAAAIAAARTGLEAENILRANRSAALVAKLRASGLKELRVNERLYGVEDLIRTAPGMTVGMLAIYESWLASAEAGR